MKCVIITMTLGLARATFVTLATAIIKGGRFQTNFVHTLEVGSFLAKTRMDSSMLGAKL